MIWAIEDRDGMIEREWGLNVLTLYDRAMKQKHSGHGALPSTKYTTTMPTAYPRATSPNPRLRKP